MIDDSGSLIQDLKANIDAVLGIRDSIGAQLHLVYLLVRTWTGERPGAGVATEVVEQILPTPAIVEFAYDLRLVEGGRIEQGDIILKGISKNAYPERWKIDGTSARTNIEHFYLINDKIYNVIQVKDKYVTWDIQIRKLASQTRYKEPFL